MKLSKLFSFVAVIFYLMAASVFDHVYAQTEEFVPGEIIVHFKHGVIDFPVNSGRRSFSETNILIPQVRDTLMSIGAFEVGRVFRRAVPHDTLKTIRTGEVIRVADASQIYKFKINRDVLQAVQKLQKLPFVIFAEPNYIASEALSPNDDHFVQGNQWGLHNTGQFGYTANVDVDAPEAWDITTGSSNVLVAILDGGIDYTHPDLGADFGAYPNQKVVQGYDYVNDDNDPADDRPTSHGTAVSGIIGALTNNNSGEDHKVAGIGGGWFGSPYGFQLLPVKVVNHAGKAAFDDLANGIYWAGVTMDANVLNVSLTKDTTESYVLRFAITEAWNIGAILVAAMGNSNNGNANWPAAYDHSVISVGAIDMYGYRIDPSLGYDWGSNVGPWIDVMAPGTDHWTTARMSLGKYLSFGGTSCSAPFVSGLAGLILSIDPAASFEKVEAIIRTSSTTYPSWSSSYGYGYIKMRKGLDILTDPGYTEYQRTAVGGTATDDNSTLNPGNGYVYKRYRVTKSISWSEVFSSIPVVWGRRSGSSGRVKWPSNATQLGYTFTGVVTGSEGMNSCQLITYAYKKYGSGGQYIGWYPTDPGSITFAYTIRGKLNPPSVYISGPSELMYKQRGMWTANPSGGNGFYTYEWRSRYNGIGPWSGVLGTSQTYSQYMFDTDFELQVKVTSQGLTSYDTHYVEYIFDKAIGSPSLEDTPAPEDFVLFQNFPNPFNSQTEIRFDLPEDAQVEIVVFDPVGRKVRRLVDYFMAPGSHSATWDGKDDVGRQMPSGIYI